MSAGPSDSGAGPDSASAVARGPNPLVAGPRDPGDGPARAAAATGTTAAARPRGRWRPAARRWRQPRPRCPPRGAAARPHRSGRSATRCASGRAAGSRRRTAGSTPRGSRSHCCPDRAVICSSMLGGGGSACWRIQVCMAIPLATPALMERVDPYWAIEQTSAAAARAGPDRPGPLLAEEQHAAARQVQRLDRYRAGQVVHARRPRGPRPPPRRPAPRGRGGSARAGTGRSPWRRAGSTAAGRRCAPRRPGRRWPSARPCRCSGRAASSRSPHGSRAGGRRGRPRSPRGASTGSGRRRCAGRPRPAAPGRSARSSGQAPGQGPTPTSTRRSTVRTVRSARGMPQGRRTPPSA